MVVSAASGRGLCGASHAHFAQIALRTGQTALPEHLAVHWSRIVSSFKNDKRYISDLPFFNEGLIRVSTLAWVTGVAAVVFRTQRVSVGQQPAGRAVQVAMTGAATSEVPDEDAFVGALCQSHSDPCRQH